MDWPSSWYIIAVFISSFILLTWKLYGYSVGLHWSPLTLDRGEGWSLLWLQHEQWCTLSLLSSLLRNRGTDDHLAACSSSIIRRQNEIIDDVPNSDLQRLISIMGIQATWTHKSTIMKANIALTSLQFVEKYALSGWVSKYSAINAWQLLVAPESNTPTRVAQAVTSKASRKSIVVKKIGPSKNTGKNIMPLYRVHTQAIARAAVGFVGTSTSAFEKPADQGCCKDYRWYRKYCL